MKRKRLLIELGDFTSVSGPDDRRNNDISLLVNYLGSTTITVQVERPFRTHLIDNISERITEIRPAHVDG